MNQPSLYHKANEVQRYDAEQLIKEYCHKLQWRNDGSDTLLDVGTGSGDVLMDFIYPIMPARFEKLVGSDISPKMINFAKDFYKSHEKCDFRVLDIGTEKDLPNDMKEQFDHVTSFYCLHWIQNKKKVFQNIYNLLKVEGGDCLLVFLAANPLFDVYKLLSKSSKWSSYMKDIDRYTNPVRYSSDPKMDIFNMMQEVGFSDIQVDIKNRRYTYEGLENFKENVKAINPFLVRIPLSLHDNYFDDFIDAVNSLDLMKNHPSKESDYVFRIPYKLFVACAKKSPNNARG